MQTRQLGYTDLKLTTVGLGTWAMGGPWQFGWGPQDDDEAIAAILAALEIGINWIDIAPAYGLGHSEELVGKALKQTSDKPLIATKCGRLWNEKKQLVACLKKQSIRDECHTSLERLGVESIDLYQMHWPDPDEDVEQAWEEMAKLAEEQKVRFLGVSNFNVEQIKRVQKIHPVASLQPPYSMLHREAEDELLDYCAQNNIGVIAYSPIQRGLLTGKFSAERLAGLPIDDHRRRNPDFHEPRFSATLELVRYGFISGACQESVDSSVELRHTSSDIVDKVILNRVLGLPIFLILMYLVFFLTFKIGEYPMGWLEQFFGWASKTIVGFWPRGSESWLLSLLVDGVIGGVGGVIVFLPNILLLFLAIALLEDSGYMARAAFIMDSIMHKIGLHGKSFIPMLIGFGCSLPAIMGTRILENRRNRFTTIMVIPLMSCGARLTIYALIIPAFFPEKWRGPMLWFMYLIGIVLAIVCIKVLRLTVFKGETTPFVMELPPYRMPTLKSVCIHMWHRGWMYLRKAGTIILAISIILWAAMSYPKPGEQSLTGLSTEQARQAGLEYSLVGRLGRTIEPALKPLGFDWKIGTALIGATAAKEVFVSQLAIVYAVGSHEAGGAGSAEQRSHSLREKLQANYTPLTGFCIMLFCLITTPCVATIVMTKHETNSWGWALFQFFGLTALAYVITLIVYKIGRFIAG